MIRVSQFVGRTISWRVSVQRQTRLSIFLSCCLILPSIDLLVAEELKLDPAEAVRRHLKWIGPEEERATLRCRSGEGIARGSGHIFKRSGHDSSLVWGKALFAAGPETLRLTIRFDVRHYPSDGFYFDGNEVQISLFRSRKGGLLATFFSNCKEYVREGLVGGVLSTGWPLLNPEKSVPKLRCLGRQELGMQEVWAFEYRIGASRTATLYFELDTLRHLATEYRQEEQELTQSTLRETFGSFEVKAVFDLPMHWTLTLEGPHEVVAYRIAFKDFSHSQAPELVRHREK